MVCPVVVGRAVELDALSTAIESAAAGTGRLVALVGEAGVGKSRLVRATGDLASDRGMDTFVGRCVPSGSGLPYRPLIDAFAPRLRDAPRPSDPTLHGFEGHLERLVPHWTGGPAGGAEESPLLLGEAVLRLVRLRGPSLVVLEDLHWADVETSGVIEYVADALDSVPLLVLATTRPDGRSHEDLVRLDRSGSATVIHLDALPDADVGRMVAACLGTDRPPPGLVPWIAARSDGLPFVVEELLAGLAATGSLTPDDTGGWTVTGELTASVPSDLASSIHGRLRQLTDQDRWILAAAAMLGRSFAWEVLPGVAEVDGRDVLDAMRAAIDAQLIDVDGDGFTFRHALTRDAILAGLLPPERQTLARRALPTVERANPGLPGAVCELAADLAETAGEPTRAAELLVTSAGRALTAGAFHTAEATARRAGRIAPPASAVAVEAGAMLVRALVHSGKPLDALALGHDLLVQLDAEGADELRLVLARAALDAGQPSTAGILLGAAGTTAAHEGTGAARQPRLDAIAAHVALAEDRTEDAVALARSALDGARASEQPAVACEALEVLGRLADDPTTALGHLQHAADLAAANDLAGWQLRARHEMALVRWGEGDVTALRETRDYAASVGALVTQAVMDLSLADVALAGFERSACQEAATACITASRRFGLATEPVAHLWLAGAHALAGDRDAMHSAAGDALAPDPDDPRILGDLEGRVHATLALVEDDLPSMRQHLDAMMDHVRRAPTTTSIYPGRSWWAVFRAMDDDDGGAAALDDSRRWSEAYPMWPIRLQVGLVEAVVRGRAQEGDAAADLVERVRDAVGSTTPGIGIARTQLLLVSMAAIRDGWGQPATWLRECEAFFADRGLERVARRCRLLLADAGAPVPRRSRSGVAVPASLRAIGVTSREFEVLGLVVDGCTTREIAERLVISARTVERHVENLFTRTGVRDRTALVAIARGHGLQNG